MPIVASTPSPLVVRIGCLFVAIAALMMASGIGVVAASAHANAGREIATAALMLLTHAPMLASVGVAIAVGVAPPRVTTLGAGVAFLGCALFCGDMMLRATQGTPLFPLAAPTGGSLAMAGWTIVFIGLLLRIARR